ncbi:hypothetical protein ACEPPN_000614 [Leptodophora sp. 'Broadleaf-Isolate-01']
MYLTLGLFVNHWPIKIIAENAINTKNWNDLARLTLRRATESQMAALGAALNASPTTSAVVTSAPTPSPSNSLLATASNSFSTPTTTNIASSPLAFLTQAAPSDLKINQLRLELAKELKAKKHQLERHRLAYLTPAAIRARALRGAAKDTAEKAPSSVTIKLCQVDGCTRPRDVPNGNNTLKRCQRCIETGLGTEYEAMAVEIMTPPAEPLAPPTPTEPAKRATKLTSKKRDFLETNIDIEEGKLEALVKRRKKAAKLDDSTQACQEIDDLAGTPGRTLALQQIKANSTAKSTSGKQPKALVKPRGKLPVKKGARRGRKPKVVQIEFDIDENRVEEEEEGSNVSDAGDNEFLV